MNNNDIQLGEIYRTQRSTLSLTSESRVKDRQQTHDQNQIDNNTYQYYNHPYHYQQQVDDFNNDLYNPSLDSPVQQQVGVAIKQSKLLCFMWISVTFLKIIPNIYLQLTSLQCSFTLKVWLLMLLIYDIFYLLHNAFVAYYTPKTPLRFLLVHYDLTEQQYQDTNLSGFIISQIWSRFQQINGIQVMISCEHYHKNIGIQGEFLRVFYILIFIYGNIIFFVQLYCYDGIERISFLIFLAMGYCYLFIPLVLCISWPCLIIILYCFQNYQQNTNQRIQKPIKFQLMKKYLKPKNYQVVQPEINSTDEKESCAICFVEYQSNQKILQLPCNQGHYFHQDCCEKWLTINRTCPICRENIEQLLKDQK